MKISINENPALNETEIIINCKINDEQILRIVSGLKSYDKKLTGTVGGQTFVLNPAVVIYIESVDKKTFLYTQDSVLETPLRLYELEENLASEDFIRISKSAIINFSHIRSLRPEMGGRLILTLSNGERIFASRQYAAEIKHKLGI